MFSGCQMLQTYYNCSDVTALTVKVSVEIRFWTWKPQNTKVIISVIDLHFATLIVIDWAARYVYIDDIEGTHTILVLCVCLCVYITMWSHAGCTWCKIVECENKGYKFIMKPPEGIEWLMLWRLNKPILSTVFRFLLEVALYQKIMVLLLAIMIVEYYVIPGSC